MSDNVVAGKRILIVDDEESIRQVMRTILKRAGAVVTDVGSGLQAIVEIGNSRFDAIFMDLNMPEFSGQDSIKAIKEHNPDSVIIVYSGFEDPGSKADVLNLGVSAVLEKPASASRILHTLKTVLDQGEGE